MENSNFNQHYLPLLLEHFKLVEKEIETLESYITEENFDEFFQDYMTLQNDLISAQREIGRVAKELGMSKKKLRNYMNE